MPCPACGQENPERAKFCAPIAHEDHAQRMEALAESGHIALSERTARLVEGYFQLQDRGRIRVKGVSEPVGLFDLTGVGRFRTRLDRSRARGLSAFVGRDRDMAFLEAALERARGGGGQVLGVVAEADTGKSRLCAEFLDGCRARGIPVFEGRGVAHGKSIPLLPMLELWRAFYGISEGDSAEVTRAKIAGRLLLVDEGYREALPILFDLFGVSDPANPSPPLDPPPAPEAPARRREARGARSGGRRHAGHPPGRPPLVRWSQRRLPRDDGRERWDGPPTDLVHARVRLACGEREAAAAAVACGRALMKKLEAPSYEPEFDRVAAALDA